MHQVHMLSPSTRARIRAIVSCGRPSFLLSWYTFPIQLVYASGIRALHTVSQPGGVPNRLRRNQYSNLSRKPFGRSMGAR